MPRTSVILALASLLAACDRFERDEPPPPPAPPPIAQPAPPIPPPVPVPVAPPPVAPVPPPAVPRLSGAYELVWIEDGPGLPRQPMPETLISQIPGCIWARWGWDFAEDGTLAVSNEMLCEAPADLGRGHGICRAEFSTGVGWTPNGFRLASPVAASSRFVLIEQRGEVRDTATVRCNVRVGALDATLTDVVPGPLPSRPGELTLQLADGGRMRLRAVSDPQVDHGAILDRVVR